MTILKYSGITLITLAITLVFSELSPKLAKISAACIGVFIFIAAADRFFPTVSYIKQSIGQTPLSAWSETIFKALGIAFIVEITADACRDAGESGLAAKLELCGKAELLLLALPLIEELFELTQRFIP